MDGRLIFLIVLGIATTAVSGASEVPGIVVDIGLQETPSPQKVLASLVCAGLYNRGTGPSVYTLKNKDDAEWLRSLSETDPDKVTLTPLDDFIAKCIAEDGPTKGILRYSYSEQQILVPQLITVAAVLDLVPLEDDMVSNIQARSAFDAVTQWKGFTPLTATEFIYENFVHLTTTMSKMNPGLDTAHPLRPKLVRPPTLGFTDYIVKEKLFNFFLSNGCIPLTKEHALMEKIAKNNPWPRPIRVFGYDNTWFVGGAYLFEAETWCVKEHNMGQVATDDVNNMSFFSRAAAITTPMQQNPDPQVVYSPEKTYIALIVGDGDNVAFMKSTRKDWFNQRTSRCHRANSATADKECFPLLWTISPHLTALAPDMMRWYYDQARTTTADYFVLPPSGYLYAYPAKMKDEDQDHFVENTEQMAELLGTNSAVAWETFLSWGKQIRRYFPKYSEKALCTGFFAVNVPFNFPILSFRANEYYKVLGEKNNVVLFRPREWRGTGDTTIPFSKKSYLTVEQMAAEVNAYEPGTVTAIYVTSDGGANLDDVYDMVAKLGTHVEVVSHTNIVHLALDAHSHGKTPVIV